MIFEMGDAAEAWSHCGAGSLANPSPNQHVSLRHALVILSETDRGAVRAQVKSGCHRSYSMVAS